MVLQRERYRFLLIISLSAVFAIIIIPYNVKADSPNLKEMLSDGLIDFAELTGNDTQTAPQSVESCYTTLGGHGGGGRVTGIFTCSSYSIYYKFNLPSLGAEHLLENPLFEFYPDRCTPKSGSIILNGRVLENTTWERTVFTAIPMKYLNIDRENTIFVNLTSCAGGDANATIAASSIRFVLTKPVISLKSNKIYITEKDIADNANITVPFMLSDTPARVEALYTNKSKNCNFDLYIYRKSRYEKPIISKSDSLNLSVRRFSEFFKKFSESNEQGCETEVMIEYNIVPQIGPAAYRSFSWPVSGPLPSSYPPNSNITLKYVYTNDTGATNKDIGKYDLKIITAIKDVKVSADAKTCATQKPWYPWCRLGLFDCDSECAIKGLAEGTYTVAGKKEGYEDASIEVSVPEQKEVKLSMERISNSFRLIFVPVGFSLEKYFDVGAKEDGILRDFRAKTPFNNCQGSSIETFYVKSGDCNFNCTNLCGDCIDIALTCIEDKLDIPFDKAVAIVNPAALGKQVEINGSEMVGCAGPELGYSASATVLDKPNWVFLHEIGHNLGLGHLRSGVMNESLPCLSTYPNYADCNDILEWFYIMNYLGLPDFLKFSYGPAGNNFMENSHREWNYTWKYGGITKNYTSFVGLNKWVGTCKE